MASFHAALRLGASLNGDEVDNRDNGVERVSAQSPSPSPVPRELGVVLVPCLVTPRGDEDDGRSGFRQIGKLAGD